MRCLYGGSDEALPKWQVAAAEMQAIGGYGADHRPEPALRPTIRARSSSFARPGLTNRKW